MRIRIRIRQSRSAFTLIELLVVVSVIALLLAILLPSISMGYESGNMAVCATQMNQFFHASFQYASDNEDRIPFFAGYGRPPSLPEWWATQTAQAMDQFEEDIYTCPSDKNPYRIGVYYSGATISLVPPPAGGRSVWLAVTYRGACDLAEPVRGNTSVLQARKFTSWSKPTEAMMMIEAQTNSLVCFRFQHDLGLRTADGARNPTSPGTGGHLFQQTWERHLGQSNFLFIDGHVDTLLPLDAAKAANQQEHYLN